MIEDCKNAQPDSAEVLIDQLEQIADKIKVELPNIKAEHQTVEG